MQSGERVFCRRLPASSAARERWAFNLTGGYRHASGAYVRIATRHRAGGRWYRYERDVLLHAAGRIAGAGFVPPVPCQLV